MSIVILTKWGNSIGIRIPKNELTTAHAHVGEQYELIVEQDGSFILKPLKNPQQDWTQAFNKSADQQHDEMLLDKIENDFDKDEWTW